MLCIWFSQPCRRQVPYYEIENLVLLIFREGGQEPPIFTMMRFAAICNATVKDVPYGYDQLRIAELLLVWFPCSV